MRNSFAFFLFVMATGWSLCSAADQSCERITHRLCKDLGYNYTVFPNRFNQYTQDQAMLGMHKFYPLLKTGCSSSLRKFLCSMYMPVCSKTPLPPCRSLCELVKLGCGPVMKRFGISWPKKVTCSDFPYFGDKLCISRSFKEDKNGRVCERISVPMCKGIGYNYTIMPNIFNHDNQAKAALEVGQYSPLVKIACSSSFRKFLCSVYTPRCTQTGGTIPPCRSLCEESKRGCEQLMKKYGFSWPTKLKCSSFPVEGGDTSCIAPDAQPVSQTTFSTTATPASTTTSPSATTTSPATHTSKCEKMTIPLCQGISYNYTMYPNLLNHRTQVEAGLEVQQYYPLVEVDCSSSLKLFLCTVYAPKCSYTLVPPCRSLCERSYRGCQSMLRGWGFLSWPANLNCLNFPVEGDDTKCIAPDDDSDITTTRRPTPATLILPPIKKYRTLLTKAQGVFTSPNYPKPYPQKIECNWIIQLPDSYKMVKITIKKMLLEEDRNCMYDYIIIKDKMLNQVGPRHCGTYSYPFQVPVRGNKVIITFVSDGSTSKAGFVIKYRGLQNDS